MSINLDRKLVINKFEDVEKSLVDHKKVIELIIYNLQEQCSLNLFFQNELVILLKVMKTHQEFMKELVDVYNSLKILLTDHEHRIVQIEKFLSSDNYLMKFINKPMN